MAILTRDSRLSVVLANHSELIPVINRFGIRLGVGNHTVEELCQIHHLNVELILTILNVYLDENYLPDKNLSYFNAELIADYFKQTIENYTHELIPNIEKHLNALVAMSGEKSKELNVLKELFVQFKHELSECWESGFNQKVCFPNELLNDLKSILIKHIPANYNQNLCYAVIFSITSFEKDLERHNRLRNKILRPKLAELNQADRKHLRETLSDSPTPNIETRKSHLTRRETEILKLIVQGKMNKEIASELHISLNTVLTHRKNIITKTGIKTVSGLTFYCIQHGLTSM